MNNNRWHSIIMIILCNIRQLILCENIPELNTFPNSQKVLVTNAYKHNISLSYLSNL